MLGKALPERLPVVLENLNLKYEFENFFLHKFSCFYTFSCENLRQSLEPLILKIMEMIGPIFFRKLGAFCWVFPLLFVSESVISRCVPLLLNNKNLSVLQIGDWVLHNHSTNSLLLHYLFSHFCFHVTNLTKFHYLKFFCSRLCEQLTTKCNYTNYDHFFELKHLFLKADKKLNMTKYFHIAVRFMPMLSLILNILLTSFRRLGITRASFSLSPALCMPPFNIYAIHINLIYFSLVSGPG